MKTEWIYIKNMVCDRCIMVVSSIVTELELPVVSVGMGQVAFSYPLTKEQMSLLNEKLSLVGFVQIIDKREQFLESIKDKILNYVNCKKDNQPLSEYLTSSLGYDYNYISAVFSSAENMSIERYLITHKVEKIKELMFVGHMSLTEIAYQLGYSSLPHMSSQFKKVTSCTPGLYRKHNDISCRKSLDNLKVI